MRIRNEEVGFSELVISDEPVVVGLPIQVEPLYSVDGRDVIGFRWYDAAPQPKQLAPAQDGEAFAFIHETADRYALEALKF